MQLSKLFNEDRAVSPVIGVILMVAITVILAAVIGTFVLGLGDSIGDNAPSASYDWDEDGTTATVTHVSGQTLDGDLLTLNAQGTGLDGSFDVGDSWGGDTEITSGDRMVIGNDGNGADIGDSDVAGDDELRIVWTSSGGGTSSTLTSYTVQG